jgi:hypothetical protein
MAKSTAKKAKRAAAAAAVDSSDDNEQLLFDQQRAAHPAPPDALRRGFDRTHSARRCQTVGASTRAEDVAKEARRTLLGITDAVKIHGATIRYRPERLRYAMDLVHELERSIERQSTDSKKSRMVSSQRKRAEHDARVARSTIIEALGSVVSASDAESEAFAEARGNLAEGTDLVKSTQALALLAKRWASHEDDALRALAEHQGVDAAMIERAESAAKNLRAVREDHAAAGGRNGSDDAVTNEIEGRVVLELGALYDAFSRNRADTKIPLPRLGATTLRALRKGEKSETAKEPPPAT